MNIYLAEIRSELKRTVINVIAFLGLLIFTLIIVKLLDDNGSIILKLYATFDDAPDMLKNAFSYLGSEEISIQMKTFLFFASIYSFPILFNAMTSCLYAFEKEEETGTICFLFDNPITRKEIVVYKYFMGVVNYGINILIMFIISTFLILISYSDASSKKTAFFHMFNIWSAFFIVGVICLSIGVCYAANKKREDNAASFAFGFFLWTSLVGLLPFILEFVAMMIMNSGRDVEGFVKIVEKFSFLKYLTLVYWCNPIAVYENSMGIILFMVSCMLIIILYLLSVYSYKKREFGE